VFDWVGEVGSEGATDAEYFLVLLQSGHSQGLGVATSTHRHKPRLLVFLVVEGGATTAVGAVGHGLPTGVLREAGVQLVLVLHLGVDVGVGVDVDVGVGVLVDVGGAVSRLEETLGGTGGVPGLALPSDQSVPPLSEAAGGNAVLELVVVLRNGEARVQAGRVDIVDGVGVVDGLMRIKHNTVIILDVSSIVPSSYSLPAQDQRNSGDSQQEDRSEAQDQNRGHLIINISTLVSEDSVGGEICEVTGGVAGVGLHQPVPHPTPGLGLDIPVNTTLRNASGLEREMFDSEVETPGEESVLHCPAEHGDNHGDNLISGSATSHSSSSS